MKILVNKKRTIELKGNDEQCQMSIDMLKRNGATVEIAKDKNVEIKENRIANLAKAREAKKAKRK